MDVVQEFNVDMGQVEDVVIHLVDAVEEQQLLVPEKVVESVTEPIAEPANEPVDEPVIEPVNESVNEPVNVKRVGFDFDFDEGELVEEAEGRKTWQLRSRSPAPVR